MDGRGGPPLRSAPDDESSPRSLIASSNKNRAVNGNWSLNNRHKNNQKRKKKTLHCHHPFFISLTRLHSNYTCRSVEESSAQKKFWIKIPSSANNAGLYPFTPNNIEHIFLHHLSSRLPTPSSSSSRLSPPPPPPSAVVSAAPAHRLDIEPQVGNQNNVVRFSSNDDSQWSVWRGKIYKTDEKK